MRKIFIKRYISEVISHGTNTFSLISFLFAMIAWFIPVDSETQVLLFLIFSVISVLISGYLAWEGLAKKEKNENNFSVHGVLQEFTPEGYNGDGALGGSQRVFIKLDIVNELNENITISRISLKEESLSQNIFLSPDKTSICGMKHVGEEVFFPKIISAGERDFIRFIIYYEPNTYDAVRFSKELSNVRDFTIDLEVEYSDMQRNNKIQKVVLEGDYESFVNSVKEFWLSHDQVELTFYLTKAIE